MIAYTLNTLDLIKLNFYIYLTLLMFLFRDTTVEEIK
jgi:hypothetical protein